MAICPHAGGKPWFPGYRIVPGLVSSRDSSLDTPVSFQSVTNDHDYLGFSTTELTPTFEAVDVRMRREEDGNEDLTFVLEPAVKLDLNVGKNSC